MTALSRDGWLLFVTRALRMFAYGFLSVILALYLSALGLSDGQVGTVLSVTLAGSAVTTAVLALIADRWGRRRFLITMSLLLAATGAILATGPGLMALLICASLGTFSPSGQEVGPFQSLEQAGLAEVDRGGVRVATFAWYNLVGTLSSAVGALVAGRVPPALEAAGLTPLGAQQALVWAFAATGLVLAALSAMLSDRVEAPSRGIAGPRRTGLHQSRRPVLRLAALFGLDSLAGGLVVQSLVAYWFHRRYGLGLEQLGPIFFGTNLLSAISFLLAARLAKRFGLLNTMVFTHLPSNVLLVLVPLMPTWQLAAIVLILRHSLSQMDIPTRQAYTMILVTPEERAAAAGITNAARTAATSLAPVLSGLALQAAATGLPFFLAGGIKVIYDLSLWQMFRRVALTEDSRNVS